MEQLPHTFRTGILAYYLIPPLAFLYLKKVVEPSKISQWDLLCFLPALFLLIDYLPFYLLPGEAKLDILKGLLPNLNILLSFNEGWITPIWFHQIFRHLAALFFWILSVRLLIRIYRIKQADFHEKNRNTIRWLSFFVIAQFFVFAPYLVIALLKRVDLIWAASIFPDVLFACITCLVLFFEPSIIYGFEGIILPPDNSPSQELANPIKSKANNEYVSEEGERIPKHESEQYLNKEKLSELEKKLSSFLLDKKAFLVPGYNINDFAKDCGIPNRRLSSYLNQALSMSFTDFINKHRIEYCVKNLEAGSWKNLTLEAIATESGFNHRNSFTRVFKKNIGVNPSEFISNLTNRGR
jgi:AraC-like DNA-binding protein